MNSSVNGNAPSISCPITFPGNVPGENVNMPPTIVASGANIVSSFIATTANFLVMWAIKETHSMHTPSGVSIFVLALSDFAVGVFIQPLCSIHLMASLTNNLSLYCMTGAVLYPVGVFLALQSFMTITAITFDRYLALVLHLRYAAVINVSRVIKFHIAAFVFFFPIAVCFWFIKANWFQTTSFCIGLSLAVFGILAIPFCYFRIFTILRRHKKQLQNQNDLAQRIHGFSQGDISKYRRSVFAILYVLVAMMLSYLPCMVSFLVVFFFNEDVSKEVLFISCIVVLVNSSINPLFYCWRITEIRRFAISKLRRFLRGNGQPHNVIRVEQVNPVNN